MKTIIKIYLGVWGFLNLFGTNFIQDKVQILIPEGILPLGEQFFLASLLVAFLLDHSLQQHWTSYQKIP